MQVIWTPNTKLQNKYIIQRSLAGGGFGKTYLAEDTRLKRLVVIKTLNEKQQEKENFSEIQQKFIQEAEALAKCQHPHIVQVYDMFEEKGLEAIVMEHIDGNDLELYVNNYNCYLPESEGLKYIDQIGQALECVHKNGLLHRDVKPSNILLRKETKQAVLIDFGLARDFQPAALKTMTGMYTEGYAPIEQYDYDKRKLIKLINVANVKPGHYTDVYALAATLYTVLTQRPPLPSYSLADSGFPLPTPQQFNDKISNKVNAAILQAMQILPENRPQSIREFRELLGLLNQPVINIPIQPSEIKVDNSQTIKIVSPQVEIPKPVPVKPQPIEIPKLEIPVPPQPKFQSFTENLGTIENNRQVLLDMIAIPGGKFLMGSSDNDKEARNSEKPQHEVTVPPFYMGKYPVTQLQWQKVASLPKVKIDLKLKPSHFKGENLPVETVSWFDAQEFCARLSKATGKKYRLPSEAEWEYACRAKTTTRYYFGDSITTDLANFNRKYGQTTEVEKFSPNAFGLYDMHGNVWEWCEDNWHENYINAPTDGSAWISRSDNAGLLRGGSWSNVPVNCLSAYRDNGNRDYRSSNIGFRVVCFSAARTL
ncbi:bifunctional serine/threonine-protein kinase/formylglycine-generating enzyme family protein [Aphanizomenon sp. PH219]|nr:bifunctional serine/threonine-protein kinase/formylglycine-generating enzyme family protein [Aphanizomenon sp. 202]MDK2460768.1 bifunctional serine/threonine-protein kinase/formylglycine-generating enzyme family protein [Aphanizomenon sp. PH219]